ncbi:MAG: hypothetical protein M3164_01640 [Actinomycetota bacterium]|nr:hypothetical protein [Actinomycetota bacterium]
MLARVIVDVPVWSLNRELTYEIPDRLEGLVNIGSIVRVPLRNRRVRGWVVGLQDGEQPHPPDPISEARGGAGGGRSGTPAGLQPIMRVSGPHPIFDETLLGVATQLSRRYVHPLSSFLSLFTPPRMGWRSTASDAPRDLARYEQEQAPESRERYILVRLGAREDPGERYAAEIQRQLSAGNGVIVVVPEVREGSRILGALASRFSADAAVVHSGLEPAKRSGALWSVAAGRRRLVLGGRAAVFAPPLRLGSIIVHQEHDPSLKEQRAPYYDGRVVAAFRAAAFHASVILASKTPSFEALSLGGGMRGIEEPQRRSERASWPMVELVEPARRGLPERVVGCLVQSNKRGERVLICLPRVHATPSGPGPSEVEAFVSRVLPRAVVGRADRPHLGLQPGALRRALEADVVIATEAALADVERPPIAAAVALGIDALLHRPSGKAAEDALHLLWDMATLVAGRTPRGRLLIETRSSDHHVIQAVVRGDYRYFASRELLLREDAGVPPSKTLIRIQSPRPPSEKLLAALASLPGTTVLGPSAGGTVGWQMLLKVEELQAMLDPLNEIAATSDEALLVEMDPRDW